MKYIVLETIQQAIARLPNKTFEEFYSEYVLSIQDYNLTQEVKLTSKKVKNDALSIIHVMNEVVTEMEDL